MDTTKQIIRNDAGSICIEIALAYPFFIIVLFCFIFNMSMIRCEMLYKSIILKESEKVCLPGILSEYSSVIINKITDGNMDSDETGLIMKQIYELSFKKQIDDSYKLLCAKNKPFKSMIMKHNEFLEGSLSEDDITLTSIYWIHTPFGDIRKQFTIPLRLWDHGDNSGKVNQNEGQSVWLYDNFKRGWILRRRFGGNLPIGYPVLSGFSNGNALIINSMDLTAPSWASPADVYDKMEHTISEMASFQGTADPWGEGNINISPSKIKMRFIKFIIPENSLMEKYETVFKKIINSGQISSIQIEIIPYQKSPENSNKQ
ncbi:MAG: endonuclease toxin domain-containing protein [Saccharofermentanales bacterium]